MAPTSDTTNGQPPTLMQEPIINLQKSSRFFLASIAITKVYADPHPPNHPQRASEYFSTALLSMNRAYALRGGENFKNHRRDCRTQLGIVLRMRWCALYLDQQSHPDRWFFNMLAIGCRDGEHVACSIKLHSRRAHYQARRTNPHHGFLPMETNVFRTFSNATSYPGTHS